MNPEKWLMLWHAHSELPAFKKKLAETKTVIREFLNIKGNNKVYVAWSTGKDSTAMLHLVLRETTDIRVMSQDDDIDTQDITSYRDNIVDLFKIKVDQISSDYNLLDFIKDHDIDITEDVTSKNSLLSAEIFYKPIEKYFHDNKFTGFFMGLRKDESRARELNFLKRGHIYRKANGAFICQPMARWTARDIFSYFAVNNIPINPIYFYVKFKKGPESIRSNFLLPGSFSNKGEAVWIKYYFPEIFNKLIGICPKILNYV